ncbi:dynein assembly factor 4, axonemal isoform X1 [Electrophorus electricus]|uniref:dynein assembly factor 4, axonemal isoform X1 n=1 Tax=Electrophorus electricus TaxID=8005 RepID=UPI0015CFFAC1|nr:dynein assembly factor 4, axonemal isoform X1 [Electrophorus electricus]
MPLIVKDYTWTQTETTVYISIPLKAVKTANVDVLCTDEYLKVSFPPYLFEAFFFQPIEDDKSVAKIGNGAAVFTLPKKESGLWEHLCRSIDKDKQRENREEAVLKTQEKSAEKSKAKATRTQQEKKYTLETMMKLEEEERASIQRMKDEECARATVELEAWKEKQRKMVEEEEARRRMQGTTTHNDKHVHQLKKPTEAHVLRTGGEVSCRRELGRAASTAPREAGCIKISFTPRVFPTALRESRVPEEQEWLRKQVEARRAANADLAQLEDLKEEERNPDWLKDKGDAFFRLGNYQAAVNAYDLAIKLNRHIPALFSNRAACHLKMRNLHKAIEDSSRAMELLTPAVADNAAARMKAHVRRGTAFCELELYVEGLQDYQAALQIDPHNQALRADANKIREVVQGTTPSS